MVIRVSSHSTQEILLDLSISARGAFSVMEYAEWRVILQLEERRGDVFICQCLAVLCTSIPNKTRAVLCREESELNKTLVAHFIYAMTMCISMNPEGFA